MLTDQTKDRMKQLAICVDDFGLHEGVNQAVFDLLKLQRISAVSCLVDGPGWQSGAAELKQLAYRPDRGGVRQADVGLHLNLTECLNPRTQAACPSQPLGLVIRQSYGRRWDRVQLQTELERQWDSFVQVWGALPDFVDGHQHVHQLPHVRDALMALLDRKLAGVPDTARPWVRQCRAPAWGALAHGVGWPDAIKAQIISTLGAAKLGSLASSRGLRVSSHLLGVYPFDADAPAYLARWRAWLSAAQSNGDLVMCHPARPGVDTQGVADPILASRYMELAVLTGADWGELLSEQGVRVAPLA